MINYHILEARCLNACSDGLEHLVQAPRGMHPNASTGVDPAFIPRISVPTCASTQLADWLQLYLIVS